MLPNLSHLNQLKRKRQPSASNARGVDLHIDLPPPDLSQFKAPDAPVGGPPAAVPPPQPVKPPEAIFGKEVKEMFTAIRLATMKAGEIVRYQADTKKLNRSGAQALPVPQSLMSSFSTEVEKLDQVCDVIEAQILHAMAVLLSESKRRKAKLAEEQAAKAAEAQPEPVPEPTQTEMQPADVSMEDASAAPPAEERRLSTMPTVVSLSSAETAAEKDKPKPGRRFSLKLDLSAPGIKPDFAEAKEGQSSPVTLAPKTAKSRGDDPLSALDMGLGGLGVFGAAQAASGGVGSGLPMSAVVGGPSANQIQALLPGILGSMGPPLQPAAQVSDSDILSSLQATTPSNFTDPTNSQEIIDLTGSGTPALGSRPNLALNVDDQQPMETIDLTLDSPDLPLGQLVGGNEKSSDNTAVAASAGAGAVAPQEGVGGLGFDLTLPTTGDASNTPDVSATDTSALEGLFSTLADGTAGDGADALRADATNLLAGLGQSNSTAQPSDLSAIDFATMGIEPLSAMTWDFNLGGDAGTDASSSSMFDGMGMDAFLTGMNTTGLGGQGEGA